MNDHDERKFKPYEPRKIKPLTIQVDLRKTAEILHKLARQDITFEEALACEAAAQYIENTAKEKNHAGKSSAGVVPESS